MKTFIIPGELPTMNEIIAASKKHHMQYANMKAEYTNLVRLHARQIPKMERVDIRIIWYCKNKRKDKDGITAGQKFILDGLVEANVIKNDGWNEIGDISHAFAIDKHNPRIEIRLKEVE